MALLKYSQECLAAARGDWPASGVWASGEGRATALAAGGEGRQARPTSIPIFDNRFVDNWLARAHPLTPIIWFGPFILYGLVRGARALGPLGMIAAFLGGWLIWSLLEYLMHRFLFHHRPADADGLVRSFVTHGYHHEFPNDKLRLVAPPLMSWPLAAIIIPSYLVLAGRDVGWALFAGTATGYVAYDWIHYYAHHFKPRHAPGRWLKRYHLLHHYDATWGTHRFGVSSPLWDFVFGTYQPVRPAGGVTRTGGARTESTGIESARPSV
jgi:sterol desaturase/sphingolipid hydroxylase (fatty acid hydroxylase superfamily)